MKQSEHTFFNAKKLSLENIEQIVKKTNFVSFHDATEKTVAFIKSLGGFEVSKPVIRSEFFDIEVKFISNQPMQPKKKKRVKECRHHNHEYRNHRGRYTSKYCLDCEAFV